MSFQAEERYLLRRLCRLVIPADAAAGLVAGDDPAIIDRLMIRLERRAARFQALLRKQFSAILYRIDTLSDEDFESCCSPWLQAFPAEANDLLERLIPPLLQSYYEDFRVQQVYQRRPGAPFPEGYSVTEGDWSLLDEVKRRASMYRKVPS
jgi:hypothetical protein